MKVAKISTTMINVKSLFIKYGFLLTGITLLMMNCQEKSFPKGTFGHALQQLEPIADLEVLQNEHAMIAVSGSYQTRIFTSTATGESGRSYGWFNQTIIDEGNAATNMAGLGGESRLWFAPEWGPYSLCFEKGQAQTDANLRRPQDLNDKPFSIIKKSKHSLTCEGNMQLKNDHDFIFDIGVKRTITLLSKKQIEQNLQFSLPNNLAYVGFSAENTIENIGQQPFKKETGLIGIWELGCMLTSPDNVVILPLSHPIDSITEYFAEHTDHIHIKNQIAYYRADANGLSKIGIPPQYCQPIMGSYSPIQQQLNIVTFSFEKDGLFVNSLPDNTAPYQGDVINIFNGVVNDRFDLPFYEFESVASAKELQPQEKMRHIQTTYHFEGELDALDKVAKAVLGVSLNEIPKF